MSVGQPQNMHRTVGDPGGAWKRTRAMAVNAPPDARPTAYGAC